MYGVGRLVIIFFFCCIFAYRCNYTGVEQNTVACEFFLAIIQLSIISQLCII